LVVPPAVVEELRAGRLRGLDLPEVTSLDWIEVRPPRSLAAVPLVSDLGPGETQVLALALESSEPLALLDDALARRVAASLGIKREGTLGLLLDARRARLVAAVGPFIDRLHALGFRVDPTTREVVLRLAGESATSAS
jgi:hypothetical protein